MANTIKLKSRAADATAPTTGNLADREVAVSIPGKTIYINDAGTVKPIANYFPDAPSDGKQYARKDGAWDEVASGGGSGNFPPNIQNTHYTFVAGDAGKVVTKTDTTPRTYQVNNSVFSAGDMVGVLNAAGNGSISINFAVEVTCYYAGSALTGNRTIGLRGFAWLYFRTASEVYITGGGVG